MQYKSDLIRQCVREISGRTVYLDYFNICVESIKLSLVALEKMKKSQENKTIAILGGEKTLGPDYFAVNYDAGLELNRCNIDEYIFLGVGKNASEAEKDRYGDAYALYQGTKKALRNKNIRYYNDLDVVADIIAKETKPGDAILIKGIIYRPFFPILDMAFGTSYSNYSEFTVKKNVIVGNYIVVYCEDLGGSNITKCVNMEKDVRIPNLIDRYPVYRVGKNLFIAEKEIETVDFGKSVMNIGANAFRGCKDLKTLEALCNVIHIEEYAFAECTSLETVYLLGVEHIEKYAFKDCINLKSIYIGKLPYH